jgi:hypothetical protein
MPPCRRTVIDYATGENWEMPLELYDKYERDSVKKTNYTTTLYTWIQYWISTLSEEEKRLLVKK